jgi:bacterioferritin
MAQPLPHLQVRARHPRDTWPTRRIAERQPNMPAQKEFLNDIQTIRKRAREHIEKGAVTDGYRADRKTVLNLLNAALATEIVCVLRYKRHYFMASGIHAKSVAAEFLEHANEEQVHADKIAKRIVQLGGAPDLAPDGLATRSHSEYVEGDELVEMIEEDLVAERIAIDTYRGIIQYLGNDDPTTRRLMEGILAQEEEHAEDLGSLLEELGKKGEPAKIPLRKLAAR